jgi:hypothetical protein
MGNMLPQAFKKGHPMLPGAGRKKGTPNRLTREIKGALLDAFNQVGAERWLVRLARKEPRAFAALLSKLLPTQVTGRDGEPIELLVEKAQLGLHNLSDAELGVLRGLIAKAGLVSASSAPLLPAMSQAGDDSIDD